MPPPEGWLLNSVPNRPAPVVVWLDRGMETVLQVRVPATAVPVPATMGALAVITIGIDPHKASLTAVAAQAALHCPTLRAVAAEDQTTILRLLAERRDDLAGERTRILNRLHGLLRDLLPGGAPSNLSADKAAALLRGVRLATATAACRRQLARDLRRVDARLADNKVQLRDALATTGSTVIQVYGLGVVVAAKLLGHVGDIGRFPSQDHFASYTATAPLDTSSGNHQRHRLNPGGDRQLNAALHVVAVCQARDPGPGRIYYLRKLSEGKTLAEARRALKRRLANVVYRRILADQRRHQPAAA
jgi:transposase